MEIEYSLWWPLKEIAKRAKRKHFAIQNLRWQFFFNDL